jgi:hypothetical protein
VGCCEGWREAKAGQGRRQGRKRDESNVSDVADRPIADSKFLGWNSKGS